MSSPPPILSSIETITRLVDQTDEVNCRKPSGNANKLYYTASDPCIFGLDVCNVNTEDVHFSVAIIQEGFAWVDGDPIPSFSYVAKNLRLEADGTDGSIWTMPVKTLISGDRVVVWSDLGDVTFFGHGFVFTGGG